MIDRQIELDILISILLCIHRRLFLHILSSVYTQLHAAVTFCLRIQKRSSSVKAKAKQESEKVDEKLCSILGMFLSERDNRSQPFHSWNKEELVATQHSALPLKTLHSSEAEHG